MQYKILVIENDSGDQILIETALQEAELVSEIITTTSGEEGIKKAVEFEPDIVITDYLLTGMDGFEVCRNIRKMNPNTIIIMLSGWEGKVESQMIKETRDAGANAFCKKTSDFDKLCTTLKKIITRDVHAVRLYVLEKNKKTEDLINTINDRLDNELQGKYSFEVIELFKQPNIAFDAEIFATPTLDIKCPDSIKRIIGDLSKVDDVFVGLGLKNE